MQTGVTEKLHIMFLLTGMMSNTHFHDKSSVVEPPKAPDDLFTSQGHLHGFCLSSGRPPATSRCALSSLAFPSPNPKACKLKVLQHAGSRADCRCCSRDCAVELLGCCLILEHGRRRIELDEADRHVLDRLPLRHERQPQLPRSLRQG